MIWPDPLDPVAELFGERCKECRGPMRFVSLSVGLRSYCPRCRPDLKEMWGG